MAFLVYLVFCLYLHACTCTARTLVETQDILTYTEKLQDVRIFELGRSAAIITEDTKHDSMILCYGKNGEKLDKTFTSEKQEEREILVSRKIMQQTYGSEMHKRAERSLMSDSLPENAENTMNSKEKDTTEDIVVMDYAQPHRKPPIHNRGT